MSPRQFHYLDRRYKSRLQHAEYLAGLLASVTANYAFGSKASLDPVDFPLPTLKRRPAPLPSDEELAARINRAAAAHAAPKR